MGFGSTILEGTQNKLFAHWFHGSWLAFVIGADIAWGRIVSIVIPATAVPLANVSEWWGWALWVPFFVCCLSTAATVAYWLFERKVPRKYRPVLGRHAKAKEGEARKIQWNLLRVLPKFFWVLCSTQVLQNATVSVYSSNLADMQVVTRGTKELAAGYNSSLQGVIPIVLTPLAGLFFDKVGWRCIFISWTAALYVVVFALIGLTTVHPLAPILISSFALSTNAITFNACIPVLVGTQHLMGTAFGVWRAFVRRPYALLTVAKLQHTHPRGGRRRDSGSLRWLVQRRHLPAHCHQECRGLHRAHLRLPRWQVAGAQPAHAREAEDRVQARGRRGGNAVRGVEDQQEGQTGGTVPARRHDRHGVDLVHCLLAGHLGLCIVVMFGSQEQATCA